MALNEVSAGTFSDRFLQDREARLLTSFSPIDGQTIGQVKLTSDAEYETVIAAASENFSRWARVPAPVRGQLIRELADEFRQAKSSLAKLITLEMGKILPEAEGEVQEVIDIADFAVGLSRQLYGQTMHSERAKHRMYEQWHPLGNVGVITAFNFPIAVWSWNALIAAVCGNSVIWKPSEITPLTAVATIKLCERVTKRHGFPALFTLMTGDGPALGQKLAADARLPLISATGSCQMGYSVAETVGRRLGRTLLELGGNNGIIVLRDANLDLVIRAVLFGAVGTAGQRCTTTRRLLVDREIHDQLVERLLAAYRQVRIGNPFEQGTLMGPLVHNKSVEAFKSAIARVEREGGRVVYGGKVLGGYPSPLYVEPTIVLAHPDMPLVREETFAPILYVLQVSNLEEAIRVHNAVPQGLSSAIFTNTLQSAEEFLAAHGSDCGIANVNIGTSGAEIGGAFGGEKATGGGREAGSDSWKAYMRRQTNTINWSFELPLAQGIQFGE